MMTLEKGVSFRDVPGFVGLVKFWPFTCFWHGNFESVGVDSDIGSRRISLYLRLYLRF